MLLERGSKFMNRIDVPVDFNDRKKYTYGTVRSNCMDLAKHLVYDCAKGIRICNTFRMKFKEMPNKHTYNNFRGR
jgi:hypothetical protein